MEYKNLYTGTEPEWKRKKNAAEYMPAIESESKSERYTCRDTL